MPKKENDVYRDAPVRYLGYAHRVGEGLRGLLPREAVAVSYALSTGFIFGDIIDKGVKANKSGNDNNKRIAIDTGDAFIWQMLATVIIPGFCLNKISYFGARLLCRIKCPRKYSSILPGIFGLIAIPFIIKPIDSMVDYMMDNTYRQVFSENGGKGEKSPKGNAKK